MELILDNPKNSFQNRIVAFEGLVLYVNEDGIHMERNLLSKEEFAQFTNKLIRFIKES
jgi:hypothetical protein